MKFPGSVIAKKTGYHKGTVSAYLKNQEPSEAFIKTFCQQFGLDFSLIWTGKPSEEIENLSAKEIKEPTPMQILSVLADAFKAQTTILQSIESKMAQESTQAKIVDQTTKIQFSLQDVQGKVTTLWERQHLAIEEMREHFAKLGVHKIPASEDAHKKRDHNGGNS